MQTTHNIPNIRPTRAGESVVTTLCIRALQSIARTARRWNNRRKVSAMLDLSPHLLNDIGLSRTDVIDAIGSVGSQDPVEVLNARRVARCAEMTAMRGHKNYHR